MMNLSILNQAVRTPQWSAVRSNQRTSFLEETGSIPKIPLITEDTLYYGGPGRVQDVHVVLMKDSSKEDPVVRITGHSYSGEFDFTCHIKSIDPRNATYAEMCALVSWEYKTKNIPCKGFLPVTPTNMEIGNVMQRQNFVDRSSRYLASKMFGPSIEAETRQVLKLYHQVIEEGNFRNDGTDTSSAYYKAADEALEKLMEAIEDGSFPDDDMKAYSAYRRVADNALKELMECPV